MNDESPALRATFFGTTPAPSQMYWRGPVLTEFDGRTWTRSRWLQALPPAPVTHAAQTWDYEMALEPTADRQMVALDLPTTVPDGTRLSPAYSLRAPPPLNALPRDRMQSAAPVAYRPAERRVGNTCVRTCRARGTPAH